MALCDHPGSIGGDSGSYQIYATEITGYYKFRIVAAVKHDTAGTVTLKLKKKVRVDNGAGGYAIKVDLEAIEGGTSAGTDVCSTIYSFIEEYNSTTDDLQFRVIFDTGDPVSITHQQEPDDFC